MEPIDLTLHLHCTKDGHTHTHTHISVSVSVSLSLSLSLSLSNRWLEKWNKINVLQNKACQNIFYIFSLYVYYEISNEHWN